MTLLAVAGGQCFVFNRCQYFFLDGDTLILQSDQESETILYNRRDNRTKQTEIIAIRIIIMDCVNSPFYYCLGYIEKNLYDYYYFLRS